MSIIDDKIILARANVRNPTFANLQSVILKANEGVSGGEPVVFLQTNGALDSAAAYPGNIAHVTLAFSKTCMLVGKRLSSNVDIGIYKSNNTIRYLSDTDEPLGSFNAGQEYPIVAQQMALTTLANTNIASLGAIEIIYQPLTDFSTGSFQSTLLVTDGVVIAFDPSQSTFLMTFTNYPITNNGDIIVAWINSPAIVACTTEVKITTQTPIFPNNVTFTRSYDIGEYITFVVSPQAAGAFTGAIEGRIMGGTTQTVPVLIQQN